MEEREIEVLRQRFPHGHLDFIPMTVAEMELHSRKNRAYAQGGSPLGNFDRRAQILALYPGLDMANPVVVAVVDSLKQLDCALWQLCQGYEDDIEGLDARLGDVSVYVKLARILAKERRKAQAE